MMTISGMREKFELYRKWLSTLLNEEFINLPYKEQDKFMGMLKTFSLNCEKIHKEAKSVKEKQVEIKIKSIEIKDLDNYTISGFSLDLPDLKINFPASQPLPKVGDSIVCIIFSIDGELWYSSKEELITGR
jgi:hypothetical protein